MKINTLRFGEIKIDENKILNFQNGILAFENLKKFILIDVAENNAFKWLQSVDDTDISFLLVDPFLVNRNYSVYLDDMVKKDLEIENEDEVLIYTIVTIPDGGIKDATTNLIGPIVLNWKQKKGKQIILENKDLTIKYPLFSKDNLKKVSNGG